MGRLLVQLRIPINSGATGDHKWSAIRVACKADDDTFWDFVEGALSEHGVDSEAADALRELLALGGSKLTVGTDQPIILDAVIAETQAAYDAATSSEDEPTEQLRVAWAEAYSRTPDPSDAWDHAIKAVEAMLRPVVQANNTGATLGGIIGSMTNQGAAEWEFVLPGRELDHDVAKFVETLRLMWPNPDRHGGGGGRAPTLTEARAVVHLAAMIVQWHREGWVVRKR